MQDNNTIVGIDQVKTIMEKRYGDVQDIRNGEITIDGEVIDLDEPDDFDTVVFIVDTPVKRSGLIFSVNNIGDNDIIACRMYSLMSCGPTRNLSTVQDVEDMLDMLENDNPFEWLEK